MTATETLVLKLGGELLETPDQRARVAAWARAACVVRPLVIIHGGGRAIDAELERRSVAPRKESPVKLYLRERARQRGSTTRPSRVLFVGHEASRTGAPAILLNIVKEFATRFQCECISVLDQPGDLVSEYERYSHVLVKTVDRFQSYAGKQVEFQEELERLLERFADDPPELAFCNSLELATYGPVLKRLGLSVITLVHEVADHYYPTALDDLDAGSDVVVCPAEFIAERVRMAAPGCADRVQVAGQGLLRPNYGEAWWGSREQVLGRYGVRAEDVVVLTCGTADGRKGIDVFTEVAAEVVDRLGDSPRVWFVWLGSGFESFVENGYWGAAEWDRVKFWAEWDMRALGVSERVVVIPPVPDTEAHFAAADIFALTSRVDPFPCVRPGGDGRRHARGRLRRRRRRPRGGRRCGHRRSLRKSGGDDGADHRVGPGRAAAARPGQAREGAGQDRVSLLRLRGQALGLRRGGAEAARARRRPFAQRRAAHPRPAPQAARDGSRERHLHQRGVDRVWASTALPRT